MGFLKNVNYKKKTLKKPSLNMLGYNYESGRDLFDIELEVNLIVVFHQFMKTLRIHFLLNI